MAGFTQDLSMISQGTRYGAEIRGHLSEGSLEDKRKTQLMADTVGACVTGGLKLVSAITSFASGDILGGLPVSGAARQPATRKPHGKARPEALLDRGILQSKTRNLVRT